MKTGVLVILMLGSVVLVAEPAEEAVRPACNSRTRGQFWPAAANEDPAAARIAARSGELRLCTREGWRYGWRQVTVKWTDLLKKSARPSTESAGSDVADHSLGPTDHPAQVSALVGESPRL